jgi:hypothetical protein
MNRSKALVNSLLEGGKLMGENFGDQQDAVVDLELLQPLLDPLVKKPGGCGGFPAGLEHSG